MSIKIVAHYDSKDPVTIEAKPDQTVDEIKSKIAETFDIKEDFSLFTNKILEGATKIGDLEKGDDGNVIITVKIEQPQQLKPAARRILIRTDVDMNVQEPDDIEDRVKAISDMGYSDIPLIRKALKVAYYNTERAAEFIISGYVPDQPTSAVILDKPEEKVNPAKQKILNELEVGNRKKIANEIYKVAKFAQEQSEDPEELYPYGYIIQVLAAYNWDRDAALKDLELYEVYQIMLEDEKDSK